MRVPSCKRLEGHVLSVHNQREHKLSGSGESRVHGTPSMGLLSNLYHHVSRVLSGNPCLDVNSFEERGGILDFKQSSSVP